MSAFRIRRKKALSQARTRTEVVADGGEDDVGRVAFATLEPAAAEMAVVLHVSDHRLDSGAPPELAFNDAEHGALLAGDEHAAWVYGVVAARSARHHQRRGAS